MYPIGTRLYTSRASQIALYVEVLGNDDVKAFAASLAITKQLVQGILYEYEVTVTEANQKWLSPEPILGDMATNTHISSNEGRWISGIITQINQSMAIIATCERPNKKYYFCESLNGLLVEKRTYPNGQRAPLIEWDKVELTTEESEQCS